MNSGHLTEQSVPPFRGSPVTTDARHGVPLPAGGPPSGGAWFFIHPSAACAQCGAIRPELAVEHSDPFCSTRCARAFYGCPLDPKTERPERKAAA